MAETGRGDRPIVTVTMNPALDVSTSVAVVTPEHKLRCDPATREPGGGGINVARVAARLGAEVRAVAVVGGPTGDQLVSLMEAEGLDVVPIPVEAETRQCFAVGERSTGRQFRFVLPGPALDPSIVSRIASELADLARQGPRPIIVLSGSVPPAAPSGAMTDLIESLSFADVIVDTSGPALIDALRAGPFLVKPSARELGSVVDRQLNTEADVLAAAQKLMADFQVGAVLASIGGGGAILVDGAREPVRLRAPTVQVCSAVGAGDSMVGGVAVGLVRGRGLIEASALGVAAGTAAVLTEGSGLCTEAAVEELLPLVAVG